MAIHIFKGNGTTKVYGLSILRILLGNDSVLQDLLDLGDTILDLALLVSGCIVLSVL